MQARRHNATKVRVTFKSSVSAVFNENTITPKTVSFNFISNFRKAARPQRTKAMGNVAKIPADLLKTSAVRNAKITVADHLSVYSSDGFSFIFLKNVIYIPPRNRGW